MDSTSFLQQVVLQSYFRIQNSEFRHEQELKSFSLVFIVAGVVHICVLYLFIHMNSYVLLTTNITFSQNRFFQMMRQNCLSVYDRLLHFVRILMASKYLHDRCRHVFSYPHKPVRYLRDPTKHKKKEKEKLLKIIPNGCARYVHTATLQLTLFRSDFLSRFPCEADVGEV